MLMPIIGVIGTVFLGWNFALFIVALYIADGLFWFYPVHMILCAPSLAATPLALAIERSPRLLRPLHFAIVHLLGGTWPVAIRAAMLAVATNIFGQAPYWPYMVSGALVAYAIRSPLDDTSFLASLEGVVVYLGLMLSIFAMPW